MSEYFDAADVAIALEEKEMDLYHTMRKAAQADKQRIITLEQQLATFHSAVAHVTEDGCTRRSFVAMPEGWAMVHKDRLHDLELAEEQLADVRNQVLEECAAVAEDTAAGRDAEAIADAIRAMKRCISQ